MLAFISLASLLTLSQAATLPAGVSAASCANYPFCGPSPGAVQVPGVAAVLAAERIVKHQHYLATIANPLPIVPGLDVHSAAESAQLGLMGIPAGGLTHQAAIAREMQRQEEIIAIQNMF